MKMKTLLLFFALLQAMAVLGAEPSGRKHRTAGSRPIERATLYGGGMANMFDTYLSPQEYRGPEFRLMRESVRLTPWAKGRLWRQVRFQGYVNYTHNRADNNHMLGSLLTWNYGLHYSFPLASGFRLLAGGLADFNGGFLWNLRNGNNPASARANVNLAASAMAVWDVRWRGRLLTFRYQVDLPLAGVAFSPHYGQSYYEIFSLGNAGGVVRFTSLHNQPSCRQLLTADFPAGRLRMRVAYQCDLQQSKLNGLKMHAYSHAFMVGFVKRFRLENKR